MTAINQAKHSVAFAPRSSNAAKSYGVSNGRLYAPIEEHFWHQPLRVILTHISFCKKTPALTEFHGFEGSIRVMSYFLNSYRYHISSISYLARSSSCCTVLQQSTYLYNNLV